MGRNLHAPFKSEREPVPFAISVTISLAIGISLSESQQFTFAQCQLFSLTERLTVGKSESVKQSERVSLSIPLGVTERQSIKLCFGVTVGKPFSKPFV